MPCIQPVELEHDIGRAAVHMRDERALIGFLVDILHGLSGEIVEAVDVVVGMLDGDLAARFADGDDGFEHDARAVLNELSDGVQIGGEVGRGDEQALVVLALGFIEQLLEPFTEHDERRLVIDHDLHGFALEQQQITQRRILGAVVVGAIGIFLAGGGCTSHYRINIQSGGSHRQQADRREHGKTAADVIRHDKGFVALVVRQLFERAALLIGRGEDALSGALAAVALFAQLFQLAERDGGLGGGAGFRDDVDAEIAVADDADDVVQVGGRQVVACKVDLRYAGRTGLVVKLAVDELDRGTRAQIRAADADDDEHIAGLLDLRGGLLDAGELLTVVVHRQVEPAEKVVSGTAAADKCFLCRSDLRFIVRDFRLCADEAPQAGQFQFDSHY